MRQRPNTGRTERYRIEKTQKISLKSCKNGKRRASKIVLCEADRAIIKVFELDESVKSTLKILWNETKMSNNKRFQNP